jgi:hypothetical protein
MIDFNSWTTYLQAGLAGVLTWIVKTLIQQGKDQVKLQTVVQYYVEQQSRDAATRLDVANPAPPEIRALLQKHIHGELSKVERPQLTAWLRQVGTNPKADSSERSAALQLLTGLETTQLFKRRKKWWQFFQAKEESETILR